MNRILRTLFHAAAGAAFAAASAGAFAQAFPNKPIRWLVGYPAGSGLDFVSRVVAEQMTKTLGQPIVVDNRTGAAGAIAATAVVQSPADGYTVLCTDMGTYALNPHLYSKLSYESKRDLKMVGMMVNIPFVLFVPVTLNINNVGELISYVKSKPPGSVNFASSGLGTVHQLNMELLMRKAGIQMTHVPYKGSPAAMADLITGQVSAFFVGPNDGMPHVKAGKLKVLATVTPRRLDILPDVPTLAESGLETGISVWLGVSVPAATPQPAIDRLGQSLNDAMRIPELAQRLTSLGFVVADRTQPKQTDDFTQSEYDRWGKLVSSLNIKLD